MVSIVIPVYNGGKYIQTIIGCFERQIDRDFELIFVNDGSTDNSLDELVKARENSSLKITVVNQRNAGVSAARNVGIEKAKGDLICFCDVDDEVTRDYVSEMRSVMQNYNDVDLVICKSRLVRRNGTALVAITHPGSGKVVVKDPLSCLRDFLYGRIVSGCWTTMTRKAVLTDNNLRFAVGFHYSEDLHMLWRTIACSRRIAYLDRYLYVYKVNENSAMSRFGRERLHGYRLMKDLEGFFEQRVPQFAGEYRAYGAARMMWSIAWQAAVKYDWTQFKQFALECGVRDEMKKLVSFKDLKVALSAATFLASPAMFRLLAMRFGKSRVR